MHVEVKRLILVLSVVLLILIAGISYGLFVANHDWGFPCTFRSLSGLRCPTCGITTMFVSLLKFDIPGAFFAQPIIFVYLIPMVIILLRWLYYFVCNAVYKLLAWEKVTLISFIIILMVFGIIRNFFGI